MDFNALYRKLREAFVSQNEHAGEMAALVDSELGTPESVLSRIQNLLPHLFELSSSNRLDAAKIVAGAVTDLTIAELVLLDERLRKQWRWPDDWGWYPDWQANSRASELSLTANLPDLDQFQEFGELQWVPVAMTASHHNGYVRQASVELLGKLRPRQTIPFLLLRANDWVEPVRQAAEAALIGKYKSDFADDFVRYLPLALRLERSRVAGSQSVTAHIRQLLCRPETIDCLLRGLTSNSAAVRRLCGELGLQSEGLPAAAVEAACLVSRDPTLRLRAVRRIVSRGLGQTETAFLTELLSDPYMPVRREVLSALRTSDPAGNRARFEQCLMDRSPAVRSVARLALQQIDPSSDTGFFREFYKARLSEKLPAKLTAVAVTCLAATSSATTTLNEDTELIAEFLAHDSGAVRAAAVLAVGKLDAERYRERILRALMGDTACVSSAARAVFAEHPNLLPPEQLLELYAQRQSRHAARNLFRLMLLQPKWTRIILLLSIADAGDSLEPNAVEHHLREWILQFNRSGTPPAPGQLESALSKLADAQSGLDGELVRLLRFYFS